MIVNNSEDLNRVPRLALEFSKVLAKEFFLFYSDTNLKFPHGMQPEEVGRQAFLHTRWLSKGTHFEKNFN